MYCCGPTVYNYAHIGNLRAYIFDDTLRRALTFLGFDVTHVMNVTDVGHLTGDSDEGEDKMLKSSRETGKSVWDIAEYFTQAFFSDVDELNILRPTVVCRATDHIADMIDLIGRIEERGYTYEGGGNLYFDVSKFPDYGKLALLDRQNLKAGARVAVDEHKRNPEDFVLWFTNSKFPHQAMMWDSPWGRGYPGWHIECSAMSVRYLGEHFDIHCGGVDHIPVHHTNEIAQTEAATGRQWVNYWLHNEFLVFDEGKMSKSLGNVLTLQVLKDRGYHPLDFRYYILGGHYRTQLQFSFEALDAARSARRNLGERLQRLNAGPDEGPESTRALGERARSMLTEFSAAIEDDLNMPRALAAVWGLIKDQEIPAAERRFLAERMDEVLGLGLGEMSGGGELSSDEKALLDERSEARARRDFSRADEIRDELLDLGIVVEDTPEGPRWSRVD
jgi:cysteinyl-tRNA synthetase